MDNIMFKIVESEIGVYVVKYSLYNIFKYEFVKGMSNASGVLVFGGAMYFVYGVYGAIYNNTKNDMSTMTETQKSRKRRRISDTVSSDLDTDLDTELDTETDTETDTENCICNFIENTNESIVVNKNIKELFN